MVMRDLAILRRFLVLVKGRGKLTIDGLEGSVQPRRFSWCAQTAYLMCYQQISNPPQPTARLLDPNSGEPLAEFKIAPGSLLGGAYAYLNTEDEMVLVDGNGDLLHLAALQDAVGEWHIEKESFPIGQYLEGNDTVTSLASAGFNGEVMVASQNVMVEIYNPKDPEILCKRYDWVKMKKFPIRSPQQRMGERPL
jgi:hypothetical protein